MLGGRGEERGGGERRGGGEGRGGRVVTHRLSVLRWCCLYRLFPRLWVGERPGYAMIKWVELGVRLQWGCDSVTTGEFQ